MKKTCSLLLTLVLCLTLVPSVYAEGSPFTDAAPGHWAYDAIAEANGDGVMTGTAPGVFSPDGALNMNQFFTVLTRAFYSDDVVNSTVDGAWPNQNLDAAEKHNLFHGIASWRGDRDVTREVMAQMMMNVMVDKGISTPAGAANIPDISAVNEENRTAVSVCYALGLLSGVDAQGTFAPKGTVNRAQTATIYVRLKNLINGGASAPGTPAGTETPAGAALTNGMPVTEENVLALIEEYKNGKEPGEKAKEAGFDSYTRGSTYDPNEPEYQTMLPDGAHYGIECAKFAFAFSDDIFGDAPYREVIDPWQVRPGDLVHAPGHWFIAVTSVYSSPYYEDPCVLSVGGGAAGSIGWGNQDFPLGDRILAIYTRYPLPSETE